MRQVCQAVICNFRSGEPLHCVIPIVIQAMADWDDQEVCGKPAVDTMTGHTIKSDDGTPIMSRLEKVSIPLCAEHWDMYQQIIKGE
jgi:hypothetical protein